MWPHESSTLNPVNVYIDGFNLYHALDRIGDNRLKWLDHSKLAKTLLRDGEALGEIYFFTAVVTWDTAKQQRHTAYLKALRAVGVTVVESNFRKQPRHCYEMQRTCRFREEKKTDVAIATTFLTDAFTKSCVRAVLITSDSDQVPTVKAARRANPELEITLLQPPAPPGGNGSARELGALFSGKNRKKLNPGLLHRCLLPQDVYSSLGVKAATRPATYGAT